MTNLHNSIKSLGSELLAYAEMGPSDTEDACHKLFRHANAVALSSPSHNRPPLFELTKRILALAAEPQSISSENTSVAGSCFQPELRMARAIQRHIRGEAAPDRSPSAILNDQHNTPFAYQNADGYPTAYAWRSARFITKAGVKFIPAGAIFEPAYGQEQEDGVYRQDPRHAYKGLGLISLSSVTAPDEVHLKRMSLEFLPQEIREAAVSFGVADIPGLAPSSEEAQALTSTVVKEQITALLNRGAVPQVS
jgi:hypothetical protein